MQDMESRVLLRRWLAFNGVGAIGVAVQLAVLAVLVRGAGLHTLIATAIAVEAAILHNFLWHERWTWADRASSGQADLKVCSYERVRYERWRRWLHV